jgi:hypothetical protein
LTDVRGTSPACIESALREIQMTPQREKVEREPNMARVKSREQEKAVPVEEVQIAALMAVLPPMIAG